MESLTNRTIELTSISRELGHGPPARSNLFDFHLSLFIVFLAMPLIDPLLRYAKYSLPIIALLTLLISKRLEGPIPRPIASRTVLAYYYRWTIFYLFLIAYSFCFLAIRGDLFLRFFANSFFIVSPLLVVYFIFHYIDQDRFERYPKLLFWGLFAIFCLWKISSISSLSLDLLVEALFTSQFPSENPLAFHFGLLLLYFIFSRNFRYSIGSAMMAVLSFKRIVFPAVILSVLAYYVLNRTKLINRKWKYVIIVLVAVLNIIAVYLSYQFAFGKYDALLITLTDTSPNAFFMGRQFIYSNVLSQISGTPWFGIGIGKIDALSYTLFNLPLNLHSDLLKNYFEFGTLLFVLWICLLYYLNSSSNKTLALAIYMNTIFLTDNAFVYFDVIYVFYLLSGILIYNASVSHNKKLVFRNP
jgi:O-antigen ligase